MKSDYRNAIFLSLLFFVTLNVYASPPTEDKLVIEYQRSGGYAGVDENYSIFMCGQIVLNGDLNGHAETQEIDELLQQIETLGFYDLAPKYVPKDTCCDRFSYRLKVNNGIKDHTVIAVDGAPSAPAQLWELLKLVKHFVETETIVSPQ